MKKLIFMFTAVFFLFAACEKEVDSVDATDATPESGFLKAAGECDYPITTPMIAGGGTYEDDCEGIVVGTITVDVNPSDPSKLDVMYEITDPGWVIDLTHLYVGSEEGIPHNKKGNPKLGQFPHSMAHDPPVYSYTFTVDEPSEDYVIAAHADVRDRIPPVSSFCNSLPENVDISVINPGPTSYFEVTLTNAGEFDGKYAAWCIDVGHTISTSTLYSATVYCSYIETLTALTTSDPPHIDRPLKLAVINWIINQGYVGTASPGGHGNYTLGDVQRAIWTIIDVDLSTGGLGEWSQDRVTEILQDVIDAAEKATNYVPDGAGYIAVILAPQDDKQAMVMLASFDEEEGDGETAWGYGYQGGDYCDDCIPDCVDGMSFKNGFGGSAWGWYFYGCY